MPNAAELTKVAALDVLVEHYMNVTWSWPLARTAAGQLGVLQWLQRHFSAETQDCDGMPLNAATWGSSSGSMSMSRRRSIRSSQWR